jgi:hypothetical protein
MGYNTGSAHRDGLRDIQGHSPALTMRRHIASIAVALAAAVLFAPSLHAADTLPAEISDKAFWQMINNFSERGGSFDFEMFMSNEVTFQEILPNLLKIVAPGGVYLGVGPEQNFTYIAALRPKIAVIVDIRRQNMLEMLMYKALFETSPTRAEFVSRLFSRRLLSTVDAQAPVDKLFASLDRRDPQLFSKNLQSIRDHLQKTRGFPLTPEDNRSIEYIYTAFYQGGPDGSLTTFGTSYRHLMSYTDSQGRNRNFLVSDNNYQFVRELHRKNLIIPVVGDFAGPKALRAVGAYLKQHNAEVSAFYTSNVEEYISSPRSTWTAYCGNLSTLPVGVASTFIRFGRGGRGSFLGSMAPFIKRGC